MFLAGVPATEPLVLTLADLVDDDPIATKLRTAAECETKVLRSNSANAKSCSGRWKTAGTALRSSERPC
jgi:hypothetical protein